MKAAIEALVAVERDLLLDMAAKTDRLTANHHADIVDARASKPS